MSVACDIRGRPCSSAPSADSRTRASFKSSCRRITSRSTRSRALDARPRFGAGTRPLRHRSSSRRSKPSVRDPRLRSRLRHVDAESRRSRGSSSLRARRRSRPESGSLQRGRRLRSTWGSDQARPGPPCRSPQAPQPRGRPLARDLQHPDPPPPARHGLDRSRPRLDRLRRRSLGRNSSPSRTLADLSALNRARQRRPSRNRRRPLRSRLRLPNPPWARRLRLQGQSRSPVLRRLRRRRRSRQNLLHHRRRLRRPRLHRSIQQGRPQQQQAVEAVSARPATRHPSRLRLSRLHRRRPHPRRRLPSCLPPRRPRPPISRGPGTRMTTTSRESRAGRAPAMVGGTRTTITPGRRGRATTGTVADTEAAITGPDVRH
jgi:hypothetical protein